MLIDFECNLLSYKDVIIKREDMEVYKDIDYGYGYQ